MSVIKYVRLYADAQGKSHLQNLEIELHPTDFAPPAPILDFSAIEPATGCGFARLPPNWVGDWHPSPKRQWAFCLAGAMEYEVSGGETYRAGPGSVMLLEDISGQGHRSRIVSDDVAVMAVVQL